jgi:hypothetical protein
MSATRWLTQVLHHRYENFPERRAERLPATMRGCVSVPRKSDPCRARKFLSKYPSHAQNILALMQRLQAKKRNRSRQKIE